ncbi:MAG: GTPase HflX, partial [Candidatus Limnocylindria bacterium]
REALAAEFPGAVFVSASRAMGLDELRARLAAAATSGWRRVSVTLPHAAGAFLQRIRERGALRRAEYVERGIEIEADVPAALAAELEATAHDSSRLASRQRRR